MLIDSIYAIIIAMKIVLDTSIVFQALYSSAGASFEIFRLVREGEIKLALSIPIFEEYCDVLLRSTSLMDFELSRGEVQKVLDFIALVGVKTDIRFLLRPNLRDENDNMFVELAFASDSRFIVTKNIRDFTCNPDLRFEEIQIVSPSDFLKKWRQHYA